MKITFKKALAIIAMLSMLAGFALNVNAANTALTSTTSYNDVDTITVTATKDFAQGGEDISTLRVTDEDGATVAGIDASDVTELNGSFTVDVTAEAATLNAG